MENYKKNADPGKYAPSAVIFIANKPSHRKTNGEPNEIAILQLSTRIVGTYQR